MRVLSRSAASKPANKEFGPKLNRGERLKATAVAQSEGAKVRRHGPRACALLAANMERTRETLDDLGSRRLPHSGCIRSGKRRRHFRRRRHLSLSDLCQMGRRVQKDHW